MLDNKKQGSYRVSLNSGKNKTDLQRNFPDPEKVWRIGFKSRKMVKTLAFVIVDFQSYNKYSCKVFFSRCEIAD